MKYTLATWSLLISLIAPSVLSIAIPQKDDTDILNVQQGGAQQPLVRVTVSSSSSVPPFFGDDTDINDDIGDLLDTFLTKKKKKHHKKHPKHKHPKHPHHPSPSKPGSGNSSLTILEILESDEAYSKLYDIVKKRPAIAEALNSTDANVTLFAPVDSAFRGGHGKHHRRIPEDVITQVLLYHIVAHSHSSKSLTNGQLLSTGLTLASLGDRPQQIRVFEHNHHVALNFHTKLVRGDVESSNGVIHATDRVIHPPPNTVWVMAHFPRVFGILLAGVKRAGLGGVVKEGCGITLFAPTNHAFRKLGVKRLHHLFSPRGLPELRTLISYHISPSLIYSPDIYNHDGEMTIPTVEGGTLSVVVKKEDPEHGHEHRVIEINGESHALVTDGISSNGVVHVIDKVLEPVSDSSYKAKSSSDDDDEDDEYDDDDELEELEEFNFMW
ncbi:hypothetical protein HK104_009601 [Borealophlyctis nickersoniae]|nr:hypothetical protein HK104_009601 [Borealophlyctis nickersoniae]